jgi:hypothetical protein
MYERCLRNVGRSFLPHKRQQATREYDDLGLEDALYTMRMDMRNGSRIAQRDAKYTLLAERMRTFGTVGERESRECVENLLKIKKWKLVEFLNNTRYEKDYVCQTDDQAIPIKITGRLDGIAHSKNNRGIVEIKNRAKNLKFLPEDSEICQIRTYMSITGINKAFLIERYVDEDKKEYSSVALFDQDEDFVEHVILDDNTFKDSVSKLALFLRDENEFMKFLSNAPPIRDYW